MKTIEFTTKEMNRLREIAVATIGNIKPGSNLNMDYGDGRQHGEGRVIRNVEGFMAEWAFAKFFDVPFMAYEINEQNNDGNVDLVVNGKNLGIKSTRHPRGHLVVKRREMKMPVVPDLYALGITDIEYQRVSLVGVLFSDKVKEYATDRSTPDSYWIPQHKLSDVF